ncbi:MAG: branched-chain amino acid ABC transporter permease [Rhodocyclaceae bacterium]|jgi:branched-chain amino acid transport system permease protein|nr:branched-chain amino acid ABC transporter permease [Rhodocyclaceae bacterium]MCL4758000.1 branched-chain amino acid ABC transporter permease [Rhodocyclaceae bacterium]
MTRAPTPIAFALMALAFLIVGFAQSWSLALTIFNYCLIAAIMALGLNIQWGYAGLFNVGLMGFAALGGLAVVLVAMPPVTDAWQAGGGDLLVAVVLGLATIAGAILARHLLPPGRTRKIAVGVIIIGGFFLARAWYLPATQAIASVNPAHTGYLGGLGLPVLLGWIVGALLAAGAAWLIGRITLGLRSDYLAIATLGIAEILLAIIKYEDWLTRGVKNVNGLPRPVPFEVELQQAAWVQEWSLRLGASAQDMAVLTVKLCYAGLALAVLMILLWFAQTALNSPWGRMMRAIRDNETAAGAMGKNVTGRHLQVFVLGSAIVGLAGAMLVTMDGQFTPGSYVPLRFTFLIWVMVIVGGSGNNYGAILGGVLIWFLWVEAEPVGAWLIAAATSGLAPDHALRVHLIEGAAHMRVVVMGLVLLLTLRFRPRGLLPERIARSA